MDEQTYEVLEILGLYDSPLMSLLNAYDKVEDSSIEDHVDMSEIGMEQVIVNYLLVRTNQHLPEDKGQWLDLAHQQVKYLDVVAKLSPTLMAHCALWYVIALTQSRWGQLPWDRVSGLILEWAPWEIAGGDEAPWTSPSE